MGWRTGYKMFIGSRFGRSYSIGRPLNHIFEDEESLLDAVERAILFYQENGMPGERFCFTIERIGFEKVEQILLGAE